MYYKMKVEKLPELYALIASEKALYLPIEEAGAVEFRKWDESSCVRLDCLNTLKSAKGVFLPQSENLVAFKTEGKNISVIDNSETAFPFVIFGVRACDARSFDILDRVFLSDPVDTYYKTRRDNATVVTLACSEPEETCFCRNFGIDAADPAGDASAWIVDGELYIRPNTEKGETFVSRLSQMLEEAADSDNEKLEAAKQSVRDILGKLPFAELNLDRFKGDNMLDIFHDPAWKPLSESCLGCGTCTYVCPTCQCYDIKDFDTGSGIQRYRTWDSCMFSDFTKTAGGQPRPSQVERFRQRFMHKLVYYPMNNDDIYGCVGCGRCVAKCPVSMNIVKVIKTLGGEKK